MFFIALFTPFPLLLLANEQSLPSSLPCNCHHSQHHNLSQLPGGFKIPKNSNKMFRNAVRTPHFLPKLQSFRDFESPHHQELLNELAYNIVKACISSALRAHTSDSHHSKSTLSNTTDSSSRSDGNDAVDCLLGLYQKVSQNCYAVDCIMQWLCWWLLHHLQPPGWLLLRINPAPAPQLVRASFLTSSVGGSADGKFS